MGMFRRKGRKRRSFISEPINIVTGSLGAGKTLFAIEQADLLRQSGDATQVYQLGINEPDLRKLPALPFPIEEWHEHADAGELKGAVIIVDEFHKCMPQRGQGRPPKFVEEMAEARKRGVRFIFLTQSAEFDHFLKGTRLNRHFYLSRKSGQPRSTIYEWQNRFVANPEENKDAKKAAMVHLGWKHPVKEYGDWYKSAESHHFRVRLPLRIMLVPFFIVFVGWALWSTFDSVGGLLSPDAEASPAPASTGAVNSMLGPTSDREGRSGFQPTTDPGQYLARFNPVIPTMPYSAPVFQDRPVRAEPDMLCVISGDGLDGNGTHQAGGCSCFTEQATPYQVEDAFCRQAARGGFYNPYRAPLGSQEQGGAVANGRQGSERAAAVDAAPHTSMIRTDSGSPWSTSGGAGGEPPAVTQPAS